MASKAFSLVEIIIAVFVIGVGLAAAALFIASSFRTSLSVKNLLIASHLAQEGIELARNIRDGNWLDPSAQGWSEGLENTSAAKCTPTGKSFCPFSGNLDFLMDSVANIRQGDTPNDEFDRLYFDPDTSRYLHNPTFAPTRFYRYLVFEYKDDPNTAQPYLYLKSIVRWKEGDKQKQILIQEKLYNWK
jgi:prepilin-type N-terminal cleavage/methylation domain-containing protein